MSADFEQNVRKKYQTITKTLIDKKVSITTMESITSGQIASLLTDTEGASAILKGAFVTYSNEAKIKQGVPSQVIEKYGVYSEEVAIFMAMECRKAYGADIGIGITGSAGNVDPANNDSVPGEVYFAIDCDKKTRSFKAELPPMETRLMYKLAAADLVADRLLELLPKITSKLQ